MYSFTHTGTLVLAFSQQNTLPWFLLHTYTVYRYCNTQVTDAGCWDMKLKDLGIDKEVRQMCLFIRGCPNQSCRQHWPWRPFTTDSDSDAPVLRAWPDDVD